MAPMFSYMILFLHLILMAYSQPTFNPQDPCFTDFFKVVPSDCKDQLQRLQWSPDAQDSRAWGVVSDETRLPRTLFRSDGCNLMFRRGRAWTEPAPSFKLADYAPQMWKIYESCVISGTCHGGSMTIGPSGGVEALLWNPPFAWESNVTVTAILDHTADVEEADVL